MLRGILLICLAAAGGVCSAAGDALGEINRVRMERGLHPLRLDGAASASAAAHAGELAERRVLSHVGLDGSRVGLRYRMAGGSGRGCGENLGAGDSFADILEGWLESDSHRANLLNERWLAAGVAVLPLGGGRELAVAVFTDSRWESGPVVWGQDDGGGFARLKGRFYFLRGAVPSAVFALVKGWRVEGKWLELSRSTDGGGSAGGAESGGRENGEEAASEVLWASVEFVLPLPVERSGEKGGAVVPVGLWYVDRTGLNHEADLLFLDPQDGQGMEAEMPPGALQRTARFGRAECPQKKNRE